MEWKREIPMYPGFYWIFAFCIRGGVGVTYGPLVTYLSDKGEYSYPRVEDEEEIELLWYHPRIETPPPPFATSFNYRPFRPRP